jgi:tetratricopeptide (TPR) repeat protein
MRLNDKRLAVLLVLAVMPLSGCGFMQKLRARDSLNKGVKAFTDQKYAEAAQLFEKALDQDPGFETARMYLGTAYLQQYIPGSIDPKSQAMAFKAIDVFNKVIEKAKDPAKPNKSAILSIATLYYQLNNLDESKKWCGRVLQAFPDTAEAYYRIGVMDYDESLKKTGIKGDLAKNIIDNKAEKDKVLAIIEDGLIVLKKAIDIKPDYHEALTYQNLLWREKAKLEKNQKEINEDIRQADLISIKAVDMKIKADKEQARNPKKLGFLGQ